jgi:predicted transcriptional regulator
LSIQQDGGSLGEAAQFAGVTRQTISRWLRTDADFRAVYEAWKQEVNQMLEGRLIAGAASSTRAGRWV